MKLCKKLDRSSGKAYGKSFEKVFREILVELRKESKYRLYFHRFTDSHAAGAFVANQPDDFLVASEIAGVFLVELKASLKYKSLRSCLSSALSDEQAKELYLWDRAGKLSLVLFMNADCLVEPWSGGYVAETYREPGARLASSFAPEPVHLDALAERLGRIWGVK